MRKNTRILAVILVVIAGSALPAVTEEPRQAVPKLFPFRDGGKDGKWGFMNRKGAVVISPKYPGPTILRRAGTCREPQRDAYTGAYIDEKDHVALDFLAIAQSSIGSRRAVPGFALTVAKSTAVTTKRQASYRPKYDDVADISEGLAKVNVGAKPRRPWGSSGGKWAYVRVRL